MLQFPLYKTRKLLLESNQVTTGRRIRFLSFTRSMGNQLRMLLHCGITIVSKQQK